MSTKKIILNFLKTGIFLGTGILLIWLVVKNLSAKDKEEILQSFGQANYFWVALVMLSGIFSNISRTIRWQIMMEPLGQKPGFTNTFFAVLVGYLANLAVPRLGEISRCGIIKKYENLPFDSVLGTVVVERIIDTLLLAIVSLITIIWQFSFLSEQLYKAYQNIKTSLGNETFFWLKTLIIGFIVLMLIFVISFRKKLLQNPLTIKVKGILSGFLAGIKTISELKSPYLFVFHSVLIWILYLVGILFGFQALVETHTLGLGPALAILFFGTFAFIVVQGGIGAYQIIVQNTLMLYGISANIGYALGWIIWGSQTITVILSGLIALILLPIINKKTHELSYSNTTKNNN